MLKLQEAAIYQTANEGTNQTLPLYQFGFFICFLCLASTYTFI